MKRILKLLLIALMICFINIDVSAKTLGDLKDELVQLENQKAESDTKKKLTESEMQKINAQIEKIRTTITSAEKNIKTLNGEIIVLEAKAEEKEDEIKDIIGFLQITDSENAYMEYIFGAQSMEDLILRSAISEQLVSYNDDLITEYNETVKSYRLKIEEMNQEIKNLDNEQLNLKNEFDKLGDSLEDVMDISVSIDTDIKFQKEKIAYYQNTLKCRDDQDINTCGSIPYAGKMIRPLVSGNITSVFGYRFHPTQKVWKLHSGIDIAGSTDVYAAAPGTVAGISWGNSCGGNMLYISHNINGVYYTTGYYHLYKVLVKTGDYVDQNTKIAITGGTPSLTPWDTCTTGRHLHFSVARGLYLQEYFSYTTFTANLVDPVTVVNFPGKGVWFSNRTKVY